MTKREKWSDSTGLLIAIGLLREVYLEKLQDIKVPCRVRVPEWKVDIWFGPIEPEIMKDSPGWFDPESITPGYRASRIPMMISPQGEDDWLIHGKLFGIPGALRFAIKTTDSDKFKLVGEGKSLDEIVMRAKLSGYVP
jgi:hypothetical protein